MKDKNKKIRICIVLSNNSENITTYRSPRGKAKFIKINKAINEEYKIRKREDKSQRNEFDRYIEHLPLTEYQINTRAVHKIPSVEEMLLEKEGEREIIREIWNLPNPQNRRVYMFIVDEFSLTEIAKIEQRAIPVIKRSIDRGLEKLRQNLKFFQNRGKK